MAPASDDVVRWLADARTGSGEALGQALETCRRYLMLVAQRELAPDLQAKGSASDLVQQTFLEAHRDFAQFHGTTEEELLAWLRQLLLHQVGKLARQYRGTAKRSIDREVSLQEDSDSSGPTVAPYANAPSPSDEAMAHEDDQALQQALERLPEDYRRVIVLRYLEERTFEEIGPLMQRSPDAARKLWARAVERLQQELEGSS